VCQDFFHCGIEYLTVLGRTARECPCFIISTRCSHSSWAVRGVVILALLESLDLLNTGAGLGVFATSPHRT